MKNGEIDLESGDPGALKVRENLRMTIMLSFLLIENQQRGGGCDLNGCDVRRASGGSGHPPGSGG